MKLRRHTIQSGFVYQWMAAMLAETGPMILFNEVPESCEKRHPPKASAQPSVSLSVPCK